MNRRDYPLSERVGHDEIAFKRDSLVPDDKVALGDDALEFDAVRCGADGLLALASGTGMHSQRLHVAPAESVLSVVKPGLELAAGNPARAFRLRIGACATLSCGVAVPPAKPVSSYAEGAMLTPLGSFGSGNRYQIGR